MKICQYCNNQIEDSAVFCNYCGSSITSEQPNSGYQYNQQQYSEQQTDYYNPNDTTYVSEYQSSYEIVPFDHTNEFDAKDISDNKVVCMLAYVFGTIGIIIALLISETSPYVAFHIRQALKFLVVQILGGIISLLLCWTLIVPLIYSVFCLIIFILKMVCFVDICHGKAKEPAIIRNFKFLK